MSACKHYNTQGYYRCSLKMQKPCHECGQFEAALHGVTFQTNAIDADTMIGRSSIVTPPEQDILRPNEDTIIPDTDKPPLSHLLRFPNAINGCARLLEHGAQKHGGFLAGKASTPVKVTADSLLRHLTAILNGEEIDPDSGYPHRFHLLTNALFIAEFRREG